MRLDNRDDRRRRAGEEPAVGQHQSRLEEPDGRRDRVEDDRRTGRPDAALRITAGGDEDVGPLDQRNAAREEHAFRQRCDDAVHVDREGRSCAAGYVDGPRAENRSRRRDDDGDARSLAPVRDDPERDRGFRVAPPGIAQARQEPVLSRGGDEIAGPERRHVQ
jgi:hypothetical protein